MKKFILLVFIVTISFASTVSTEVNILNFLFEKIFQDKNSINIWDNYTILDKFLCNKKQYICINDINKADLIILNKAVKIDTDKPIFVLKYYLLKRYKDRVLGGFYWQKGRPNIIFIKENLKKFHIKLPNEFSKYLESIDDL